MPCPTYWNPTQQTDMKKSKGTGRWVKDSQLNLIYIIGSSLSIEMKDQLTILQFKIQMPQIVKIQSVAHLKLEWTCHTDKDGLSEIISTQETTGANSWPVWRQTHYWSPWHGIQTLWFPKCPIQPRLLQAIDYVIVLFRHLSPCRESRPTVWTSHTCGKTICHLEKCLQNFSIYCKGWTGTHSPFCAKGASHE